MIFLLLLLFAVVLIVRGFSRGAPRHRGRILVGLLLVVASLAAIAALTSPQQLIAHLVMPLTIAWLLLSAVLIRTASRQSWTTTTLLGAAWVLLTLASHPTVATQLGRAFESQYDPIHVEKMQPLDAVCVLGGGAHWITDDVASLTGAGDRVATGARLYHAGVTSRLVTVRTTEESDSSVPLDSTAGMLVGLGVPAEAIDEIEASNTETEIQALSNYCRRHSLERIGVVSSAWHLPRVARTALRHQFDFVPLPADFFTVQTDRDGPKDHWIATRFPHAQALQTTQILLRELLAHLAMVIGIA